MLVINSLKLKDHDFMNIYIKTALDISFLTRIISNTRIIMPSTTPELTHPASNENFLHLELQ